VVVAVVYVVPRSRAVDLPLNDCPLDRREPRVPNGYDLPSLGADPAPLYRIGIEGGEVLRSVKALIAEGETHFPTLPSTCLVTAQQFWGLLCSKAQAMSPRHSRNKVFRTFGSW
jgi:hypothetical protein